RKIGSDNRNPLVPEDYERICDLLHATLPIAYDRRELMFSIPGGEEHDRQSSFAQQRKQGVVSRRSEEEDAIAESTVQQLVRL
ncbi:hypothetical protein ABTM87_19935, partial [Acinetobacter baumannii]